MRDPRAVALAIGHSVAAERHDRLANGAVGGAGVQAGRALGVRHRDIAASPSLPLKPQRERPQRGRRLSLAQTGGQSPTVTGAVSSAIDLSRLTPPDVRTSGPEEEAAARQAEVVSWVETSFDAIAAEMAFRYEWFTRFLARHTQVAKHFPRHNWMPYAQALLLLDRWLLHASMSRA